jgi:UDP-N-acetylmuramate: L-alanyl-gamma-D-glutamyl-meso-diaminopimelate ligase
LRPKFHWYRPQIGLLTGIAWDHINVFPTFDKYVEQFGRFAELMPDGGTLVYYSGDKHLDEIAEANSYRLKTIGYAEHEATTQNNKTALLTNNEKIKISVFGRHNLQNISGAKILCNQVGITDAQFYKAIPNFKGAARRLETLASNSETIVYRDFAHSPSKLKATIEAVKSQFPERELVACMELHTFSSLKKEFLPQYADTMKLADRSIVFYDPHTIEHKKLEPITPEMVKAGFEQDNLEVYTNSDQLYNHLRKMNWRGKNLLLMSSGNFSGKDLVAFANEIV